MIRDFTFLTTTWMVIVGDRLSHGGHVTRRRVVLNRTLGGGGCDLTQIAIVVKMGRPIVMNRLWLVRGDRARHQPMHHASVD